MMQNPYNLSVAGNLDDTTVDDIHLHGESGSQPDGGYHQNMISEEVVGILLDKL